ncbi:hypothetical protein BJ508DRAFT_329387 [Ascobolus immersus RN42]|uniref:PiggyBac transposable element-derived protein 4 C-terminal zinc-ribbon domain-containing protein n=1 Tax=Ascobolus immersus RN42 TaxID=1160509 RepID=A0A3N4HX60_ASCIM|nr:hypothetical protein BJ508DRAFT_329387 [Ascobolus immersus RN42]
MEALLLLGVAIAGSALLTNHKPAKKLLCHIDTYTSEMLRIHNTPPHPFTPGHWERSKRRYKCCVCKTKMDKGTWVYPCTVCKAGRRARCPYCVEVVQAGELPLRCGGKMRRPEVVLEEEVLEEEVLKEEVLEEEVLEEEVLDKKAPLVSSQVPVTRSEEQLPRYDDEWLPTYLDALDDGKQR